MASHPYISGPGNITQIVGFLRRNFPATVNLETVKKYGLASKNESYVINVLHFLGLIDEQGKRTEVGLEAMSKHVEGEFQQAFGKIVMAAYSDIFELRGEDAWTMTKDQLTGYFRNSDKTSDIIGARQAGVFVALRELAGHETEKGPVSASTKAKMNKFKKSNTIAKQSKSPEHEMPGKPAEHAPPTQVPTPQKGDIALTVRIEINLPAEGTKETYDAIFKSIKANLYP